MCFGECRELAGGILRVDASHWTNRGEISISEVVCAARAKPTPDRRESGRAGAGADDQNIVIHRDETKMPRPSATDGRGDQFRSRLLDEARL
jgi:hypothetical protein